jgi:hypothetical protein
VLPEFNGKIQVITIITGVKSPYILGPLKKQQANISRDAGIDMIG